MRGEGGGAVAGWQLLLLLVLVREGHVCVEVCVAGGGTMEQCLLAHVFICVEGEGGRQSPGLGRVLGFILLRNGSFRSE